VNADRLLARFDRVADAPDAVPRLRHFILDLAVRGRLVEQDPADEPASELLKRIEVERAKASKARKSRSHALKAGNCEGGLFNLPAGWKWVALSEISDVTMGQSPPGDTYNKSGDGVPLINGPVEFTLGPFGRTVINQFTTAPTKFCEAGDLLICVRGSTTGRTNIAAFRACIGRGVAAVRSSFDDEFIRLFLWKQRENIISMGRGIAFPSVSKKQLACLAIPLPPLAEQHRIVARVNKLMALCDRLEASRGAREQRRDRLTAAGLARLNAPDPDAATFRTHARFAIGTLPAMTARADQVARLRRTILELAVRGRLVKQDPADEPASHLVKRIMEEYKVLVQRKKLRKKMTLEPIAGNLEPFPIPHSWKWSRLGDLFHLVTDGAHHTPIYTDVGVPFLSVKDVSSGTIRFENVRFISEEQHRNLCKRCCPERGDILLTKVGTTGIAVPVRTDIEFSIFVSVALLKFSTRNLSQDFLCHLINSPFVRQQSSENTQGIGNQNLVLRLIRNFALPIPPLAEQHRIFAKVDELMALCDRLEAGLAAADTSRQRMLESLIHEALDETA